MEYLKIGLLLLLGIFCVLQCGAVEQEEVLLVAQEPQVVQEPQVEQLKAEDNSEADGVTNGTVEADDTEGGARKVRQYFGPPPPPFYGGYGGFGGGYGGFGGGYGGFGGGYGGFGGGYGFQRTRVVTRTRYRGRYGGFGGGFGGVGFYG